MVHGPAERMDTATPPILRCATHGRDARSHSAACPGARARALLAAGAFLATLAPAGACDRARFRIVLDVGHTERAPGAISARGVIELDFNRRLADTVAARLADDGFASVTVIEGRGVGHADLLDRAARASDLQPDAFVSLHHDSVQAAYLQRWTAENGTRQMHSEHASGFSLFVSRRNAEPARSLALARAISTALTARGLRSSPHHAEPIAGENRPWADKARGIYAFDNLVVLKEVAAPAALLESGVIVNRDEETVLASDGRRALVADALAQAFAAVCETDGR